MEDKRGRQVWTDTGNIVEMIIDSGRAGREEKCRRWSAQVLNLPSCENILRP